MTNKTACIAIITLCIFIQNFASVSCSGGDQSPFYQRCVSNCRNANCTKDGEFTPEAEKLQDQWSKWLQWGCLDECRYGCMWLTVEAFQERGFAVPKFHGKWPFKRFLGIQEPASTLFSLLNLAAHVYMVQKIARNKRFSVRKTPLLLFWYTFFLVCANAWVWSCVFHARDTLFTEFMDYACALSMVMALLVAAIVRTLRARRFLRVFLVIMVGVYFVEHVRYLHAGMLMGRIDYGYNMLVNVLAGGLASITWLLWSWREYRLGRRHPRQLVAFTVLSAAALALELGEFSPRFHIDAHALWHAATSPLPLLFYRFVIDDLAYLQQLRDKQTEHKLA